MHQLDELAPDLAAWLLKKVLHTQAVMHHLTSARLHIADDEKLERERAATTLAKTTPLKHPLLRSTKTGETVAAVDAFQVAAEQHPKAAEHSRTIIAGMEDDLTIRLRSRLEYLLDLLA
jgi:hypothetical protein